MVKVIKKTEAKTGKTSAKKPVAKKVATTKPVAKKTVKKNIAVKPIAKIANGIPEKMRDAALKMLNDKQAEDIVSIELAGRSSVADYLLIASGRAGRQIAALADYLSEAFYKNGAKFVRVEGKSEANWVLIDAGDVIVHLFRPEVRKYYDLDAIWNGKRAKA